MLVLSLCQIFVQVLHARMVENAQTAKMATAVPVLLDTMGEYVNLVKPH